MTRAKKIILIILAAVLIAAVTGAIIFFSNLRAFHFEYYDVKNFAVFTTEEYDNVEALHDKGISINYPEFTLSAIRRMTGYNYNEELAVYAPINYNTVTYLTALAEQYDNRVKLDYSVEMQNDRLTIEFFGTAYPDSIYGTGIALEKSFVYDISNVSAENPPRLIS